MLFSETCEKVSVTKGVLSADCKKADKKSFFHSSIPLNDYIGNVDGKLTWGGRGFSHTSEEIHVTNGVLSAKLKSGSKLVESKLDLNLYIQNEDGHLSVIPRTEQGDHDNLKIVAPELHRALSATSAVSGSSMASAATASSMFSASSSSSMATTVSSSSVTKMSSTSSSSATFSSSKFRTSRKMLLIEETCQHLKLVGTVLHAECHRLDGTVHKSHIDLDTIIGFVDGRLEWDMSGFSKHCTAYHIEDHYILAIKYKTHTHGADHKDHHYTHTARLDLRTRLRNADGTLIIVELNKKLSVMLSEVPWMKFKVIAEPDLSVFAQHPVMQETLAQIAETTVQHVTVEMHKMLTIAMESAISVITASAMKHVSAQMETLVSGVVGQASASASITAAESLHLYGRGRYTYNANGSAYGYANGGSSHSSTHDESNGFSHADEHSHHVLRDDHSYSDIAKHAQIAHSPA